MTIADDRIDELDFNLLEEPDFDTWDINDDVIPYGRDDLSAPAALSKVEWRETMDEMEEDYQTFLQTRLNTFIDIGSRALIQQAPTELPQITMDDIYAAVREVRSVFRPAPVPLLDWLCNCSPSRGQFFQRYMEGRAAMVEPVTCHLWVTGDE